MYVSLTAWCVIDKRQGKPATVALRLIEYTEEATANAGVLGLQEAFGQGSPQERGKGYSIALIRPEAFFSSFKFQVFSLSFLARGLF